MTRRDLLERVGPFNVQLRRNPDYDFWLRMSMVTEFLYMDRVLGQYRVMADQLLPTGTHASRPTGTLSRRSWMPPVRHFLPARRKEFSGT